MAHSEPQAVADHANGADSEEGAAVVVDEATPANAATAEPPPFRRVLVVDDELAGLTHAHLRNHAQEFVAELADINSPLAYEALRYAEGTGHFDGLAERPVDEIARQLSSDEFVRRVLMSDEFRASESGSDPRASSFYERVDSASRLRRELESAFPAPDFELSFVAEKPNLLDTLLNYDLVVLDLVLLNSANAVDELLKYLSDLSEIAGERELPSLIVLSSRPEMRANSQRFSADSNISAAGLMLLEKKQVALESFGSPGLRLSFHQLSQQRAIAHRMRLFMRVWTNSIAEALTQAKRTLWNLDASAMQEIHHTAISDFDPYDEHLNELVMREYLWHVEQSEGLRPAIQSLDECFQAQLEGPNPVKIKRRFVAPFMDPAPGRDLISHYTWTGLGKATNFSDLPAEDVVKNFNRLIPFGAVLAPESTDLVELQKNEWLVHITQQCDLNAATRPSDPENKRLIPRSVMFALASAAPENQQSHPVDDCGDLVARGLRLAGADFEVRIQSGSVLSLPIAEFVARVHSKGLRVVGRLRHDVASFFLDATVNHMTRPAQLKTSRMGATEARLFLRGRGFNGDQPMPFTEGGDGVPAVVSVVLQKGKRFRFQAETCMFLALWLKQALGGREGAAEVDAVNVSNVLAVGVAKGDALVGTTLGVDSCSSQTIIDGSYWRGKGPKRDLELLLLLVADGDEAKPGPAG
jgi:hypothetical protein